MAILKRLFARRVSDSGAAPRSDALTAATDERTEGPRVPNLDEGVDATITPWFDLLTDPEVTIVDREDDTRGTGVLLAGRYWLASAASEQLALFDLRTRRVVWTGAPETPLVISHHGQVLDVSPRAVGVYPELPLVFFDVETEVSYPLRVVDAAGEPVRGVFRLSLPRFGDHVPVVVERPARAGKGALTIAVDVRAGRERWRREHHLPLRQPFSLNAELLFALRDGPEDGDVALVALDVSTGAQAWEIAFDRDAPRPTAVTWCDAEILTVQVGTDTTFIEYELGILLESVPARVLPAIGGSPSTIPTGAVPPGPVLEGLLAFDPPDSGSGTRAYRIERLEAQVASEEQRRNATPHAGERAPGVATTGGIRDLPSPPSSARRFTVHLDDLEPESEPTDDAEEEPKDAEGGFEDLEDEKRDAVPVMEVRYWPLDRAHNVLGSPEILVLPVTVRPFGAPPTNATSYGPWTIVANVEQRPWVLAYYRGEPVWEIVGDAPRAISWRDTAGGHLVTRRSRYRFDANGCERIQRFAEPASRGGDGATDEVGTLWCGDRLVLSYGSRAIAWFHELPDTLVPITRYAPRADPSEIPP